MKYLNNEIIITSVKYNKTRLSLIKNLLQPHIHWQGIGVKVYDLCKGGHIACGNYQHTEEPSILLANYLYRKKEIRLGQKLQQVAFWKEIMKWKKSEVNLSAYRLGTNKNGKAIIYENLSMENNIISAKILCRVEKKIFSLDVIRQV